MDNSVETSVAEAAALLTERGAAPSWQPVDDLCPPWWPRRARSSRGALRTAAAHDDIRAADRMYAALTLLAATFQFGDERLAREVRAIALAHVRDAAQVLARGAIRAWERGDDVCPPFPWGRQGPHGRGTPATADAARAAAELPGRAADLLDGLSLLQTYNLAAKLTDPAAREAVTSAIGRALVEHVAAVTVTFA